MQPLEFLESVLPSAGGFLQVVQSDKTRGIWDPHWLSWPDSIAKNRVNRLIKDLEVDLYFGPNLYSKPIPKGKYVQHGNTIYADFDQGLPKDWGECGHPTILVESSPGRYHGYWRLEQPIELDLLEAVCQHVANELDADKSGWDRTQLLRIPGTRNLKRDCSVTVTEVNGTLLLPERFKTLEISGPRIQDRGSAAPTAGGIDLLDLIEKSKLPQKYLRIFQNGPRFDENGEVDRSKGLAALSYALARSPLDLEEAKVLLSDADKRWGKFKEGRAYLLDDLLTKAFKEVSPTKFVPSITPAVVASAASYRKPLGFLSFIRQERPPIAWVVKDLLHQGQLFSIAGEPTVGKTQLALNLIARVSSTPDPFLHFPVLDTKQRVGFKSLEMGEDQLLVFLRRLQTAFSQEQLTQLEQNFLIDAPGNSFPLTAKGSEEELISFIKDNELTGLVIDSLSSLFSLPLTNEEEAMNLTASLNRIRKSTGAWICLIHHTRKPPAGSNQSMDNLADLYGNMHIQRMLEGVMVLKKIKSMPGIIDVSCAKQRLAPEFEPFSIKRNDDLSFIKFEKPSQTKEEFKLSIADQFKGRTPRQKLT